MSASLPGVVVALALVAVTVRVALPLYQTVATLLAAYVLLYLARAIIALRASLAQVPVELEQAAVALGRPPLVAAIGTTLRLAAPGIAAGMALVAMGITTELTATLMLSPIGTTTLATEFWARTAEFDHVGAAPYRARDGPPVAAALRHPLPAGARGDRPMSDAAPPRARQALRRRRGADRHRPRRAPRAPAPPWSARRAPARPRCCG